MFDEVGPIDIALHYAMDYDFYLRASERFEFYDIDLLTTRMRVHPEAKTSHGWDNFAADVQRTLAKVWKPQASVLLRVLAARRADVRRAEPSGRVVYRAAGRRQGGTPLGRTGEGGTLVAPSAPLAGVLSLSAAGRCCGSYWESRYTPGCRAAGE